MSTVLLVPNLDLQLPEKVNAAPCSEGKGRGHKESFQAREGVEKNSSNLKGSRDCRTGLCSILTSV